MSKSRSGLCPYGMHRVKVEDAKREDEEHGDLVLALLFLFLLWLAVVISLALLWRLDMLSVKESRTKATW